MAGNNKLELSWVGKDKASKIEPRVLIEDTALSYHAAKRLSTNDQFDNKLIHGDNLLALKALEGTHTKKIKLCYIDPPFNTGQAFEHYDDGVEHSLWLDLMAKRLTLIKNLLADDGVLVVHLDQEEVHYLKVAADEIFGRKNFLGQVAYERSGVSGLGQGGSFIVNTHEYILWYAKNKSVFTTVDLSGSGPFGAKEMKRYNRILVNPGTRVEVARFIAPSTNEPVVIYKHQNPVIRTISLRNFDERYDEIMSEYVDNFSSVHRLTSVQKENEFQNKILHYCKDGVYSADYLVSRGKREGENITSYYQNGQVFVWLADTGKVEDGAVVRVGKLSDFWPHRDIPKADLANEGGVEFRRGKKPEKLLERIIRMTTVKGDIVLDSFGGSGTTGAVAHKMGRRWVMVEMGDHCRSHIIPRLKGIIDGTDQGGVTESTNWTGGGGFRYFKLAPSLLEKDKWGNWVINKEYDANMLAAAVCKHEGFTYRPSDSDWWAHGYSTEADFIYVTTQTLTEDQLVALSEEVGSDRTLLVCCAAYKASAATLNDKLTNLTVKKMPNALLSKCEWGKDDYSLNTANLPAAEQDAKPDPAAKKKAASKGADLFGDAE